MKGTFVELTDKLIEDIIANKQTNLDYKTLKRLQKNGAKFNIETNKPAIFIDGEILKMDFSLSNKKANK